MTDSLIQYNNKFIPLPFGLYNTGVICYFNSLIQCLMSCSSLNQYFLLNEHKFREESNIVAIMYIDLLNSNLKNNDSNKMFHSSKLLNFLIIKFKEKQKNINIGLGQEDICEFLGIFLDIINDNNIVKLFMHKYQCDIFCLKCKNISNIPDDKSYQFEIPLNNIDSYELKYINKSKSETIDISNYIRNNVSHISQIHCKNCPEKNTLVKINRLKFIPTILIITYLKYQNKQMINFPKFLEYDNEILKKKYTYILVSSVEQSGNIHGGHYICKALRKKFSANKILPMTYLFNDASFQEYNINATSNTYISIYHFYNSIDI